MFSMKKEREQEEKKTPTPPHPARCVVIQWNGSCLAPPTCHISALSQKFLYCLPYISRSKRKVTV